MRRTRGEVSLERALSKLGLASRTEGKNWEIRRMLGAAGHEVTRLKRVSFGGLELGNLEPGQWRVVAPEEIRAAFSRGSR